MTFLDLLPQTKAEAIGDSIAIGGIVSPLWLPMLHEVSETAALLAPIVGVAWLAVQITIKIHTTYWKK